MTYSVINTTINGDITTTNTFIVLEDGTEMVVDIAHYQLSGEEEMKQNIENRISSEELKRNPPVIIVEEDNTIWPS